MNFIMAALLACGALANQETPQASAREIPAVCRANDGGSARVSLWAVNHAPVVAVAYLLTSAQTAGGGQAGAAAGASGAARSAQSGARSPSGGNTNAAQSERLRKPGEPNPPQRMGPGQAGQTQPGATAGQTGAGTQSTRLRKPGEPNPPLRMAPGQTATNQATTNTPQSAIQRQAQLAGNRPGTPTGINNPQRAFAGGNPQTFLQNLARDLQTQSNQLGAQAANAASDLNNASAQTGNDLSPEVADMRLFLQHLSQRIAAVAQRLQNNTTGTTSGTLDANTQLFLQNLGQEATLRANQIAAMVQQAQQNGTTVPQSLMNEQTRLQQLAQQLTSMTSAQNTNQTLTGAAFLRSTAQQLLAQAQQLQAQGNQVAAGTASSQNQANLGPFLQQLAQQLSSAAAQSGNDTNGFSQSQLALLRNIANQLNGRIERIDMQAQRANQLGQTLPQGVLDMRVFMQQLSQQLAAAQQAQGNQTGTQNGTDQATQAVQRQSGLGTNAAQNSAGSGS